MINLIIDWCRRWQLSINVDKCQLLHLGKTNFRFRYGLNGKAIPSTNEVKDLGLIIDNSLSFSAHISALTSRARARCGVFFKTFISRDKDTMLLFYITYVRPILEYCCVVWGPVSHSQINSIENVQRYFTNKIPGCTFLPYSQRLARLGLDSLEHRRSIIDLMFLYSIITGSLEISLAPHLLHIPPSITRGHNLKILDPFLKYSGSRQNFLHRTVSCWNNLPLSVMSSRSRLTFRKNLSIFLKDPCRDH